MKTLLALILLCSTALGQTFSGFATPEHPYLEIPGQAGVTQVTVTVKLTIERSFMAANMDPGVDGLVMFNASGSFERCTVHSPLGGIIGTAQGAPLPFSLVVPGVGVPITAVASQIVSISTQIQPTGKGYAAPTVLLPVDFAGQYVTVFQSGFVRARESVHPVAEIFVTYN
jgi:hypothetical protein